MSRSDTPIPYADLPARFGVSCDRDERTLRIVLPPMRSLRGFSLWMLVGIIYFGFWFGFNSLMAVSNWYKGASAAQILGPLVDAAVPGAILLLILGFAWVRLITSTVLELTPSRLWITRRLGRWGGTQRSCPTRSVSEVKLNRDSGKLFIHILGKEFVDVFVSSNRDVTQWVAGQINDALRSMPESSGSDPRAASDLPRPLPTGRARKVMLGIAGLLLGVGLAFSWYTGLWACMFTVAIGAVAPVGIAYGLQDKEYYA